MSYIFKIYINSFDSNLKNILSDLIIFISNEFIYNNSDLLLDELKKYKKASEFINSNYYSKYFSKQFTELDLKYIKDFNLNIYFTNTNIYYDDSIEIIKLKIIDFLNNKLFQICYEELYLFSYINYSFNIINIYNNLSNNNKNKISKKKIYEFLSNIYEQYLFLDFIEDKDYYDYNDIYNLSLKISYYNEFKSLGQYSNNNFRYIVNPFNNNTENINNKILSSNIINTNNNSILFETNITNNTFFISNFQDVFKFFNKKFDNNYFEYIIKIYFPLLNNKSINSISEYNNIHNNLIDNTLNYLNSPIFIKKNHFIDILNKINFTTSPINKLLGTKK